MPPSNIEAARAFADLVARLGCRTGSAPTRLRSMTFWAGAGFSRTWELA
jgi:hypothetical protein